MCTKLVSSFLYFSNFFLSINFSLMSYPIAGVAFEISCKIGVPISPSPATTSFDSFVIKQERCG